MVIQLELAPEEEAALKARAEAEGVDLPTVLHRLIREVGEAPDRPVLTEKQKAAIALFQSWLRERETLSDEELDRNDQEFEELKANMNRWRAEEGSPPVFPCEELSCSIVEFFPISAAGPADR